MVAAPVMATAHVVTVMATTTRSATGKAAPRVMGEAVEGCSDSHSNGNSDGTATVNSYSSSDGDYVRGSSTFIDTSDDSSALTVAVA